MEILRSVHCPKCGGRVLESAKAYGCENWRDIDGGCKITIWKNTWGHDVTADEATAMFQGEEIGPVEITLKSGMKKRAKMKYDALINKCVLDFADNKGKEQPDLHTVEAPQSPIEPQPWSPSDADDWANPNFM